MRDLAATWDGDQGPIYRVRLRNGSAYRDLASAAVAFYIEDQDGTAIATRPGVPAPGQAKSDGYVDLMMRGKETDWDGAGKELYAIPMVYYAEAPDRTPATNLLVNPSFDTGAGTVADNWTQAGTLGPAVYDVRQDDPAPPVIFGKCQRCYVPSAGSTAYLHPTVLPSITISPGDYVSGGVWLRAKLDAGASITNYGAGGGYFLRIFPAQPEQASNFLVSGDTDWRFETISARAANSYSGCDFQFAHYDALGYDVRLDDAFLFKGRWAVFPGEVFRLPVQRRARPNKLAFGGENFISGTGGFDEDSNADGVADGWSKTGATNTYSIERDPDHLNISFNAYGTGAEKVVLGASATDQLRLIYRGHFKAGETWRFQVSYRNSGALSGSPANGDFGVVLETEPFDGTFEQSSLLGANFSLGSIAAYATKFRTLALTANHSVLVCKINLKTASGGTLWLDDAFLWRTV